jgi:hypothetical protein
LSKLIDHLLMIVDQLLRKLANLLVLRFLQYELCHRDFPLVVDEQRFGHLSIADASPALHALAAHARLPLARLSLTRLLLPRLALSSLTLPRLTLSRLTLSCLTGLTLPRLTLACLSLARLTLLTAHGAGRVGRLLLRSGRSLPLRQRQA